MQDLLVADVMNPSVISISHEATLDEAINMMHSNRISALVATDHSGHMVGVISQTDLLRAWQEGEANLSEQTVEQYMTRDVISCAPHKPLSYAMQVLNQHRVHRLVVVETHDGGRFVTDRMIPVGILSQTDIVRALVGQASPQESTEAVDANG